MKRGVSRSLLLLAFLLFNTVWIVLPRGSYESIVIHHSAGSGDHHATRRAHLSRGWFEIAYHLVLSNGRTPVPLGHLEPTWRFRLGLWSVATKSWQHNRSSIHLCVVGDYEANDVPEELRSTLGNAVRVLQERYKISDDEILLHRECGSTVCPGRNVTQAQVIEWIERRDETPVDVRQQHREVIRKGSRVPAVYLFVTIVCNSLLISRWRSGGDLE